MGEGWGRVLIGTRLEKQVSATFFQVWEQILQRGLADGDGSLSVRGHVAHIAANRLVREFLKTECDSLLFLDSDAIVQPNIIQQFRDYEPGYDYDLLQAFTCRRGWPPRPLWLTRNATGRMMELFVLKENHVSAVDVVPLHCTIVRRRVFETLLDGEHPENHLWFWYPRTEAISEDGAFTTEAKEAGFKAGATTAIRAGHLGELETNWTTYMEWLVMSGKRELLERYGRTAQVIAEYAGEEPDLVIARSLEAGEEVAAAWERYAPVGPEQVRAFYGKADNAYIYDLLSWNCTAAYQKIIAPLKEVKGQRALVLGPGIGTEIAILQDGGNTVTAYELPGVLRDFLEWRFKDTVRFMDWRPAGEYDVVVAVDVLEHVHPDEIRGFLRVIDDCLIPGGALVMHMGRPQEECPQHFDNAGVVAEWIRAGYERLGESVWHKQLSG